MEGQQLLILGIFGAVILTMAVSYAVYEMSRYTIEIRKRIKTLKARQMGLSINKNNEEAISVTLRKEMREGSIEFINTLVKSMPSLAKLQERLSKTGKNITVEQYIFVTGGLFFASSGVFFFLCRMNFAMAFFAALGLSLLFPHMIVGRMAKKRLKKFLTLFPDAIDLIVRGLRSGLPVPESINVISQEMEEPIRGIFAEISNATKMGVPMEKALADVAKQLKTAEFDFFTISVILQRETGGNLAEILNNLSETIRGRIMMKMKIKAMSSEARMSAYVVGALPFLVMVALAFTSPGYLNPFFNDFRGNMAALGAFTSFSLGIGIMMKMSQLEI